ncbi:hypothetical protein [Nonomuraea typhae]|uniref:hypothetical protein n=1 Tax=Nonomuraea typhae TaxID=2603600 RepID=UPI0012FC21DC|nr:hypothetical protein [Nonomuraea typhae]
MKVGYGTAGLHVPDGTPMGGYIDRPGPSAGVLDPLQVSAVTWFDGERRFALATADVICVNEDLAAHAQRAVNADLWLAATHTHAGPETGCVPGGGRTPEPWLKGIAEAVRTAVHRAVDGERPARGTLHRGDLHHVGADRSRPDAPPAVPLDVIAIRDAGALAGVVVVLPVHPTVLPPGNLRVSADLPGAVRRALSARLGSAWVTVATGAAGDISTRHTRRAQDPAELDRLGALVADRCLDLLAAPGTPAWTNGRITCASARRTLPPSTPLRPHVTHAAPADDRLARSRLEGARARRAPTGDIEATVQVARIGDLGLAGLPGEPFQAIAARILSGQTRPTAVLGYVNGYPGYLPTAEDYARAEYEVLVAAVAPGSGELLGEAVRELLEET